MNPNFRTHGIILEPSAMGTIAGKQEPNEKSFLSMHHPCMVVGAFVGAVSLWPFYCTYYTKPHRTLISTFHAEHLTCASKELVIYF
jgi:hypothetical protein